MPQGGNAVRVARVSLAEVVHTSNIGVPISFGVGRRDRAVELLGIHYFLEGMVPSAGIGLWGMALSENPEHQNGMNIPTLVEAFLDSAIYAFGFKWENLVTTGNRSSDGIYVPLYGLLVPFRQAVIFWNSAGDTANMKAEAYYRPAAVGRDELESLNRQKGAYRRT